VQLDGLPGLDSRCELPLGEFFRELSGLFSAISAIKSFFYPKKSKAFNRRARRERPQSSQRQSKTKPVIPLRREVQLGLPGLDSRCELPLGEFLRELSGLFFAISAIKSFFLS
jgi:hypothetical protein